MMVCIGLIADWYVEIYPLSDVNRFLCSSLSISLSMMNTPLAAHEEE